MKKISIVSAASLLFLMLCSAVAVLLNGAFDDSVTPLIIGAAVLLVSGVIAIIVRDRTPVNILCFLMSAVALGFLIRAWYILRGFTNTFGVMCLVSLAAVLYLWVFFALSKIPLVHRSRAAYFILCVFYVAISVAFYLVVMLKTKTTYVSTFGYYMVIELAFIFAMSLEVHNHRELIRNLTLSTYSVLVVAIIVAIFALAALDGGDCDCDCGPDDCCDCGIGDHNKKTKKKTKK